MTSQRVGPKLVAILPAKFQVDSTKIQTGVNTWLRNFAYDFQREMQTYPAALPWRSRPPKRGLRAGGRRTGRYGQGWSAAPTFTQDSVTIENKVDYAEYVGGRGQTRVMAGRNWPKITEVAPRVAEKHLRAISGIMTGIT